MEAVTTKKIRHSDVRDRIYEYLCGTKAHPSANTIYNDLKPSECLIFLVVTASILLS